MTGTLVNCVAVIAGGSIGLIFKKGIKDSYTESVNKSLGLAILIIGLNGVISNMFSVADGKISSSGELLLVVYLVIGTLFGEMLKLEQRFNGFCTKIESKFKAGGFASGFVNGTVLFCVGAMAIIGSINDGLRGDSSVLFVKSALDFTTAIIFGATLGFGVIFTFIPLLIYQGGITLLAGSLSGILQGDVLTQLCAVGYSIIMAIGINFIFDKKFKTLNMLPSIFLPVVYHYILVLINMIK
ncbi:MAG: DUF554 domain-containing protein [Oscillospiraceae bacterium]|nr:DUF554 domain-containing protein [Oscillospiraceae bacterium]